MALKMRKKEAELEALEKEVQSSSDDVAAENPYINDEEKEALSAQAETIEEDSKQISIKKMEAVVACVQREFHLSDGNYVVNAFADKGNKSQISLSNEDFDIVVTIKDNEKFGIN